MVAMSLGRVRFESETSLYNITASSSGYQKARKKRIAKRSIHLFSLASLTVTNQRLSKENQQQNHYRIDKDKGN